MSKNEYCEICKKVVWESNKKEDGFVEGYIAIKPDAKLKIESDIDEWEWDFEEIGIELPNNYLWFCSEECFKKWFKNLIKN